jgi:hypothetical protein
MPDPRRFASNALPRFGLLLGTGLALGLGLGLGEKVGEPVGEADGDGLALGDGVALTPVKTPVSTVRLPFLIVTVDPAAIVGMSTPSSDLRRRRPSPPLIVMSGSWILSTVTARAVRNGKLT